MHCIPILGVLFVCFCSKVFLFVSTGYISSFRDWMQLYLEISPFVSASYIHIMFCDLLFSAIDRHPPRSCSIYKNAANCKTIHFHYGGRGGG